MDHTHDQIGAGREQASEADERFPEATRPASAISLRAALRRARVDSAERGEVVTDLRGAALARLDMLREQLEPVFAQLPADCDMFDLGLTQGERPRLFVDMIAFVEMSRDRRSYRFLQDTRSGRVTLAETDSIEAITQAVADYLARRLIEREKALASVTESMLAPAFAPVRQAGGSAPRAFSTDAAQAVDRAMRSVAGEAHTAPRPRPAVLRAFARLFMFVVEVLGSAALFGALAALGYWLWTGHFK